VGVTKTAVLTVRATTAGLKTNTIVANVTPSASASGAVQVNAPLADWHMDETSWNGTAGEVKDSSGNGYHGRARIAAGATSVATTASASPAYANGIESTCAYGEFDRTTAPARTYSYVELSGFPTLPTSFTFSAWIRSTNASAQHQRILVRDDADNGWGLSLADGTGQPRLRFFNRNIANSGAVSGSGSNPGCGVFCLDTNSVITSNAWHYIAAAIDTVGKTVTLYVFDASGALLATTSSAFAGTWADGTGIASIGGESSASSEGQQTSWHFLGNIDELQIFSGVLSQANIENLLTRTRACSGTPPTAPANFNCVESGANASTGHLYTKLAGTGFSFDVVALKADGSTETTYASAANKDVTVELVDGSGATACASRTPGRVPSTPARASVPSGARRTTDASPTAWASPASVSVRAASGRR
jgi:MSHA biogenesis protein MshQ